MNPFCLEPVSNYPRYTLEQAEPVLDRLEPIHREVFLLRAKGRTMEEISKELGVSIARVRDRSAHAARDIHFLLHPNLYRIDDSLRSHFYLPRSQYRAQFRERGHSLDTVTLRDLMTFSRADIDRWFQARDVERIRTALKANGLDLPEREEEEEET